MVHKLKNRRLWLHALRHLYLSTYDELVIRVIRFSRVDGFRSQPMEVHVPCALVWVLRILLLSISVDIVYYWGVLGNGEGVISLALINTMDVEMALSGERALSRLLCREDYNCKKT